MLPQTGLTEMWLTASPPSQRTWRDLSRSIEFIYFPPGHFRFAFSETMLTLLSPLILINESHDYLRCPDKQMAPIHMSCEQIWWPSSAGTMAVHTSHPPSLITTFHPHPYCNALANCFETWGTVRCAGCLEHDTCQPVIPASGIIRHQGTGSQRSNGADLHHKGLSPVVLISDKVESLFWLNATQSLTTHPDPSLGCWKSSFRIFICNTFLLILAGLPLTYFSSWENFEWNWSLLIVYRNKRHKLGLF